MARRRTPVDWPKIIFWTIFPLSTVLLISLFILLQEDATSSATGCRVDEVSDVQNVAILLDATEPYGAVQLKQVSNNIFELIENLNPLDRVRIYTVGNSTISLRTPIFDFCKPNPGSSESKISVFFKEKRFRDSLEKNLRNLQGNQPKSEIISSLSSVAADLTGMIGQNRIILVSDLIEHSDIISMYRKDWLTTARVDATRIAKRRPMLDDIEVDFYFLSRANQPQQNEKLVNWWVGFISDSGGDFGRYKPISG